MRRRRSRTRKKEAPGDRPATAAPGGGPGPAPGNAPRPVRRFHQVVLISSLLPLSWLGMMAVHEAGHIAAAWLTGGKVVRVVLYPLTISRTDVDPNPNPLAVTWAGPAVGALLPLAA